MWGSRRYAYGTKNVCDVQANDSWGMFNANGTTHTKVEHSRYDLNDLKLIPETGMLLNEFDVMCVQFPPRHSGRTFVRD